MTARLARLAAAGLLLACAGLPARAAPPLPRFDGSRCAPLDATRRNVVVVLDASLSMGDESGIDADRDGRIEHGRSPGGSGDSLFVAELVAARDLFRCHVGPRLRAAIVSVGGGAAVPRGPATGSKSSAAHPPARPIAPLTDDGGVLEAALLRLEEEGPQGDTDLGAAIDVAQIELAGADAGTERHLVVVTDGVITLPTADPLDNNRRAMTSLHAARAAGIAVQVLIVESPNDSDLDAAQHPLAIDVAKGQGEGRSKRVRARDLYAAFIEALGQHPPAPPLDTRSGAPESRAR